MIPAEEMVEKMNSAGLGYDRVELLPGSTYKDNSTIVICPTRGAIHHRAMQAIMGLMAPMNTRKAFFMPAGQEVGQAYTDTMKMVLSNPGLADFKYVLSIEDDMIPPPDGHLKLLEGMEQGYDVLGGIYFLKGDYNYPQAYGDPKRFAETGVLDFRPLDVTSALREGSIIPVNGTAMGFTLYRMEIFKKLEPPWWVTVSEWDPVTGGKSFTQDLWGAERIARAGFKQGIHCGVKCGHLDTATGIVY